MTICPLLYVDTSFGSNTTAESRPPGPVGPVGPVAPAAPVGPGRPGIPCGPCGPCGPGGQHGLQLQYLVSEAAHCSKLTLFFMLLSN